MGTAILMIAVTAVVIPGFFMVKKIDVFLEENKKVIEKEQEKKEETYILLKFPETENDKNMISEIEEFKKHIMDLQFLCSIRIIRSWRMP